MGWPWPPRPTPKSALMFILQKPFSIDHNLHGVGYAHSTLDSF